MLPRLLPRPHLHRAFPTPQCCSPQSFHLQQHSRRYVAANPPATPPVPKQPTEAPIDSDTKAGGSTILPASSTLEESPDVAERTRTMQAPNRAMVWSSRQNPREVAMTGPRFEQTIMKLQPRPYAAVELIHEQPVRFVEQRMAICDGGGGPAGHPRIFINVDKPEIVPCGYCGLPYAYSHHKKHLESLQDTPFPLS